METPTLTLRTSGPQDTRAVAAALSSLFRLGDVVALSGELGAGKTCFVQGAARGLGVTGRVTSPTFVLVRNYDSGRLPIVHCDVYRLSRMRDLDGLGDEVLAPDVVTFIEWGDAVEPMLPSDRLDVELALATAGGTPPAENARTPADTQGAAVGAPELEPSENGDLDGDRVITLRAHGRWRERTADLTAVCAAWRDGAV